MIKTSICKRLLQSKSHHEYKFAFISIFIYTVLVYFSPHKLLYDEIYYIKIAQDFLDSKLSTEFISNIFAPTGILYALVHYLFYPLTHYQIPNIRFVNILFLIISFALICLSFKYIHHQKFQTSLLNSLPWLVFPTTGVISCMALTELPAIAFFIASSFILGIAYNSGDWRSPGKTALYCSISGILLGLSTWGRQNLIVCMLGSALLFLPLNRKSIIFGLSYALPALSIFFYPISIWGGLVPPSVDFVEKGFRFSNFFLSLGYLSLFSIIIYPKILISSLSKSILMKFISISLLLVSITPGLRYAPSRFLLERLFGSFITYLISYIFGIAIVFISLVLLKFILSEISRELGSKNSWNIIYYALGIMAICFSNIKINHQFSSRYITLALPFLVYVLGNSDYGMNKDKFFYIRLSLSLFLSVLFTLNYYKIS